VRMPHRIPDVDEAAPPALLQTACITTTAALPQRTMDKIDCGGALARFEIANDGIASARMHGLLVPANAGALSARLLQAGVDQAAAGIVCEVDRALVALPAIQAQHYSYVPTTQRGIPVAVVVSPEQWFVYEGIAQAAAQSGSIRRAFLSRAEAESWLREQARALVSNRAWWSARR
jgi:hypothetical protein